MPRPSFWFLLTVCTRSVFRGSWIHFCLFLLSFLIYPAEIVSNSFFCYNPLITSSGFVLYNTITVSDIYTLPHFDCLSIVFLYFTGIFAIILFYYNSNSVSFTFFVFFIPIILLFLCIPTRTAASKVLCIFSLNVLLPVKTPLASFGHKKTPPENEPDRSGSIFRRSLLFLLFNTPSSGQYPDYNLHSAFRKG